MMTFDLPVGVSFHIASIASPTALPRCHRAGVCWMSATNNFSVHDERTCRTFTCTADDCEGMAVVPDTSFRLCNNRATGA
jgi:hypothetical protein